MLLLKLYSLAISYKKVGVVPIRVVKSNVSRVDSPSEREFREQLQT